MEALLESQRFEDKSPSKLDSLTIIGLFLFFYNYFDISTLN